MRGNTVPSNIRGGVLVLGRWAYGFGMDLAQAKEFFRGQGARLSDGYVVVTFDDETEWKGIDGFGSIFWDGNEPTQKVVPARKARK